MSGMYRPNGAIPRVSLHNGHLAGSDRSKACRCGCGYPTAQKNGYVRGHTPKRKAAR